jgi:hypothetical protein
MPAITGRMATARSRAVRATALLMPEATPECRDSAAARTVEVSGATVVASPSPKIVTAGSVVAT